MLAEEFVDTKEKPSALLLSHVESVTIIANSFNAFMP